MRRCLVAPDCRARAHFADCPAMPSRLAADENAELARRLGRLLDEASPGWRDSPTGRWLNAVERGR